MQALLKIATRAQLTVAQLEEPAYSDRTLEQPPSNGRSSVPFTDSEQFLWQQLQLIFTKSTNDKPDWAVIAKKWRVFGVKLNAASLPSGKIWYRQSKTLSDHKKRTH
jgi:hypothetical protein